MQRQSKSSFAKKSIVFLVVAAICVIILAAASLSIVFIRSNRPYKPVAYVNELPISAGELQLALDIVRSDVILYFYDNYDAVQNKDFWQESYGGESTRARLIDTALEYAAKYKREQLMMIEYGVAEREDTEYKVFYKSFTKENKRRIAAEKNGDKIYGPVQYTEQGYYDYLHNNRLLELYWKVNEKVVGNTELTYDKQNFESEFADNYADIEIKRIESAISKLNVK